MLLAALFLAQTLSGALDPAEFRSSSGNWRLEVDPTERYGAGAADYRCWSEAGLAWSSRLPFTLHSACVTDAGIIVGCASTRGRRAWDGDLLAIVIEPDGSARVVAKTELNSPRAPHGSPSPGVDGPRLTQVSADGLRGSARIFLTDAKAKLGESVWTIDIASAALVTTAASDLG